MASEISSKVQPVRLLSNGPEDTFKIGQRLGSILKEGDVVALFGELGSGKTALAKGIASAFSIRERDITSASFTIVSEHKGIIKERGLTRPISFYHIDLYRLEGSNIDSLGLEEYIGRGISVIEWAENLGDISEDFIRVRLKVLDTNEREIILDGIDEEDWNYR